MARVRNVACTPDLRLFAADRRPVQHGHFDGFRPGAGATPTGEGLHAAVNALPSGRPPLARQAPPIGPSIKGRAAPQVDAQPVAAA